jgi:putative oxidoreductase
MLKPYLEPQSERVYAVVRMVAGAMFAFHGVQKVLGVLAKATPAVGSQIWVGGVIELVCGTAIAVGLFTRWAAFLASGTMAVAYTQFHWKFEFTSRFLPGVNRGELAVLYAFVFLLFACRGAGMWSVDGARRKAG